MPALPPVPQVLKIIFKGDLVGDLDVIQRLYYQYTGTAPTASGLAAAANAIGGHWQSTVGTFLAAQMHFSSVTIIDLTSSTAAEGVSTTGWVGAGSCTPESGGVAAVMQHRIARRYRGGHPRTYVAGMCNSHRSSAQIWDPTWLAGLVAEWNTFATDVASDLVSNAGVASATYVNVSFYQGFTNHTFPSGRTRAIPTLRATPLVDVITTTTGNPKIGSQRRRNGQGT